MNISFLICLNLVYLYYTLINQWFSSKLLKQLIIAITSQQDALAALTNILQPMKESNN